MCVYACVRMCVYACVRVCVRARVRLVSVRVCVWDRQTAVRINGLCPRYFSLPFSFFFSFLQPQLTVSMSEDFVQGTLPPGFFFVFELQLAAFMVSVHGVFRLLCFKP